MIRWNRRMAVNWINILDAVVLVISAKAYSELGEFDDAGRYIGEAMTASKQLMKNGARLRSIASQAKSRSSRPSRKPRKRKPISSAPSPSPANNKPNPGNSAPR